MRGLTDPGVGDPLAALEAEARAAREARRAVRRSPAVRARRQRGRIQRRRGYEAERLVQARLARFGFYRVPLSGQLGGSRHSGDLRCDDGPVRVVEVKRRQGADRVLRAQLAQGGAEALVRVPGGGAEPLVVLQLSVFERLLEVRA